ncbi:MAG: hypothetical protein JRD49_06285 [Deltaproteobacteria bacterium]|nr:hypothetical protein [Deltaproteobacteria bacterium]MBW2677160.1 hypothetical protein [Deltaproteobacteria bacterium]
MDPLSLIPTPDVIPVHWGWLKFFLIATFFLHLLFMNTMLGISIIALAQSLFKTPGSTSINREISAKLPYTIAFTVNMGVAPLLFIQVLYGQFIYTSSLLMAVYWLSITAILIIAYYSAYLYHYTFDAAGSARTIFMAITVVNLLIIGFFFSNNMTMMLSPDSWVRYFDAPGGTLLNLAEPTLIPRYLHFVLSAVAGGGLFLAIVWELKARRHENHYQERIQQSLRWFIGATLLQFAIGTWWLFTLPEHVARIFMGGSTPATALFILGMLGTILALIFGFKGRVRPCAGVTILTILVMVLMRDQMRTAFLKPYFELAMLETNPQYGSLILFLIALGIGGAAIAYMLKLAFGNKTEARS